MCGVCDLPVSFFKYVFFLSVDTLLIDYQFTFSLSQEDDRYYTAINFVATPDEVSISFKLSYFGLNFIWVLFFWSSWTEALCSSRAVAGHGMYIHGNFFIFFQLLDIFILIYKVF